MSTKFISFPLDGTKKNHPAAVSSMAPTGNVGNTSWSKWQIALIVGTPVAIGLGYWYLKRQPTKTKPSRDEKKRSSSSDKVSSTASIQHQPSLDTSDSTSKSTISGSDDVTDPQKRAQEYKNLGNQKFKAGQYEEAIELYNKAIELCPTSNSSDLSTFFQNRAAAYEQLKQYAKARDDCTKALELNPKYVKALHRRSKAYENLGNLELSLEDVTAACILENFQSESTLLMADRILKALGRKHAKEAMTTRTPIMPSKHFIKTYMSSFQEDPVTKISVTNGAVSNENLSGYQRAQLAVREKNYEDVVSACTEELESENGKYKPEALLLRATMNLLQGIHKPAMADFDKVRVNALIKRASMYMQLEDPQRCLEDFSTAAEIDPDNSDIFHHRGQVKLLLDELPQAMEDFKKAVKLNPDFPIAYVQKCYTDFRSAFSLQNAAKVQEVLNNFEDAIQRFPKCTEAYTLFAQATENEPGNAAVYVHRAILQLHWTQDVVTAVQLINEAISIDDKCEFAYETLGTIETELEMSHLFALKDAAVAQEIVAKKLGIAMPSTATST
ncbi:hypothetical protein B566_EDAN016595 [Ephemera danica]|nr:hypothetical protein B566_EDAN016595 [Ephemera danica]